MVRGLRARKFKNNLEHKVKIKKAISSTRNLRILETSLEIQENRNELKIKGSRRR